MDEDKPKVTEFPGDNTDPTVYVVTEGKNPIIGCTTDKHMQVQDIPIEQYLRQIVQEAKVYADKIYPKYQEGGEIGWFPCGTANVVLRWNEHREIIDILRKTSEEGKQGKNDFWRGWFGRLMKTSSQGWWWTPPMPGTQAMLFQEEVCKFIREKLIFKNVKVDVRTYID